MKSHPSLPIRVFRLAIPALVPLLFPMACSRDAGLVDADQVLEQARREMLSFRVTEARKILEAGAAAFPEDSEERGDYLYLLALSCWHTQPADANLVRRADGLLVETATENPEADYAPAAWLYAGRIRDIRDFSGDIPDYEGAREAYRQVMERYPDSLEAAEATAHHAVTFMKDTDDPESMARGAKLLEAWLAEHPEHEYGSSMALFLANVYDQFLPDTAKALQYYQHAYRLGFVNETRTGARLWRMAELARIENQPRDAVTYCQRIIRDYARSGRGHEAIEMLKDIRRAHPDLEFTIPELQLFDIVADDEEDEA